MFARRFIEQIGIMKSAKYLLCIGILTPSLGMGQSAEENSSQWIHIQQTEDGVISLKKGSLRVEKSKGGAQEAMWITRWVSPKKGSSVHFAIMKIPMEACFNGYGKIIETDMAGKFTGSYDYVEQGGNVISAIGWAVCQAAKTP
ncbi:hypothetical protein [Zoogloea sp.]|uniref:hypothetical protein n=1 Tax=Zoogloea sp. TaxID=49181 RepID=UPI002602CB47|nr:hypothetical protein [Zoogloea sp.]MDD3353293.1 hypothetical protein [Zoogloea sp.]